MGFTAKNLTTLQPKTRVFSTDYNSPTGSKVHKMIPKMIRTEFPLAGSTYEGGVSDGWEYQVKFLGSNLQASLDMVQAFLIEQGYAELPIPRTAEELLHFKTPAKRGQTALFGDNGYVHNPLKILFDTTERVPRKLILCLFNEQSEKFLLRFHKKILIA
jgi:hypothetical protein